MAILETIEAGAKKLIFARLKILPPNCSFTSHRYMGFGLK